MSAVETVGHFSGEPFQAFPVSRSPVVQAPTGVPASSTISHAPRARMNLRPDSPTVTSVGTERTVVVHSPLTKPRLTPT